MEGALMQALILIGIFVVTAAIVQFLGFLVSQMISTVMPGAALLTFLILFIAAYGIAWPIAVRIAEWLIVRMGMELQKADPRAL
jgi:hypothetical protein